MAHRTHLDETRANQFSNKISVLNIEVLCEAPPEALSHSPSQMPLSCPVAPPSQREPHKDRAAAVVAWRGGRAPPGPETQVLRHVLWYVLHNALPRVVHVLVLHVSPKGRRGEGARVRVAARRSTPFLSAAYLFWLRTPSRSHPLRRLVSAA